MSNLNFQTKSEKFKFVSLIFLKKKLALPETETFSCFQIHDKWECFHVTLPDTRKQNKSIKKRTKNFVGYWARYVEVEPIKDLKNCLRSFFSRAGITLGVLFFTATAVVS